MRHQGGCRCGAVRYEVGGVPKHAALCHCIDCRKSAGAPMVGWTAFAAEDFRILAGTAVTYNSSGASMRSFCGTCGTGLWFTSEEAMPGVVDIQTATLDDPELYPALAQIQVADRIGWMASAHELPHFKRYPGG